MSYGPIYGSGAEKLAESRVAPLVAVAHGFTTVGPDDFKSVAEELVLTTNSTPYRQLRSAIGDKEAMLMRWFSPRDVVEQEGADYAVSPSSTQVRPHPANVRTEANGKRRKYDNLAGQNLVFGIHPATPSNWLLNPIKHMLLAEGALKADSAMSAYLRHHGATEKELSVDENTTYLDAVSRMRKLLERIPESDRVVIMSVVGVGTWHKNPEWNTVRLEGEVWVSFDGDVGMNPNVWREANAMFDFLKKRGAKPMLVDLSAESGPMGEKVGVDDYLASGKEWSDLMEKMTESLPPRPGDAQDGKYRMNAKTATMQEKMIFKDGDDEIVEWVDKADLTARIVSITEYRAVTPEEAETGRYAEYVSAKSVDSEVTIEVEWIGDDNERHLALIEGPATLMATKPERWTDPRMNTSIPADVLAHPAWPPTANGFLEAMKTYRRSDMRHDAAWTHSGWVPSRNGSGAVFCVGDQVIGSEGFMPDAAVCGVTEDDLAGASDFGVTLLDSDDEVRAAVKEVLERYLACWTDPRHCAVVLAAALRPVIPRPANIPVMYAGPSGVGKTHASVGSMAFWQCRAGGWSDKHLPGSASDTQAATEIALSKTVIWVSDDHAPSSSNPRAQAERQEAVNQTIRNVHNGAGRRRATKDMGSQKTYNPRALYIVSAESAPLDDQSIMNRLVHVEVAPGFLVKSREPTDALDKMNRETTLASSITGYAIQMVARDISLNGWTAVVNKWNNEHAEASLDTSAIIEEATPNATSSTKRQAETVADILLGVVLLKMVCNELGMLDDNSDLQEKLDAMYVGLQSLAIEGFTENQRMDLGNRFMRDVATLLNSGQGHIAALGAAGAPCVIGEAFTTPAEVNAANQSLGWKLLDGKDADAESRGETIGFLVTTKDNKPVVLLTDAAFSIVQRKITNRGGHSSKSVFDSLWKSRIPVPEDEGWKRKPRSGNKLDYRVRVTVNGVQKDGVPIYLDRLLEHQDD